MNSNAVTYATIEFVVHFEGQDVEKSYHIDNSTDNSSAENITTAESEAQEEEE